jgi:hypothetical protein
VWSRPTIRACDPIARNTERGRGEDYNKTRSHGHGPCKLIGYHFLYPVRSNNDDLIMSYKPRRAGKSTRTMAHKRHQSALWTGLLGIAAITVIWLLLRNAKAAGIGGIGVIVLLVIQIAIPWFIERRVDRKLKEEERAIRGARAEEKIGELLADLSEDFYVLNDVDSPYGNIDHIVISKYSGIFLIETKAHGGRVEVKGKTLLVNGKNPEKDFIAQALRNAFWLRDEISLIVGSKPWINPMIVFTNAFVSQTMPVKGVSIIYRNDLLNALHRPNRSNAVNAQVWNQRVKIGDRLM